MRLTLSIFAVAFSLLTWATFALEISADLPVSALLTSAQTHLALGQTTEALVYYDAAVAKDPTKYLTLFMRATTYLSLGRAAQATDDLNKVLALKPGFEGAHLQLAKIKAKAADWDGARTEFEAAKRGADSPELSELTEAEGAARLADQAAKAMQWEDCVSHAGASILVASRSPSLRHLRARCRFERGEIEEGIHDLHHVLQMRPGDTSPHVLISATTFYGLGDMGNGLVQIRKCLHSDPDSQICKNLHKEQKLIQRVLTKAEGQLNKGLSTTAGRTLMGNIEEFSVITRIRGQVEELQKHGQMPSKAKVKLYERAMEMVCQAYFESNHKDTRKYCGEVLQLNPELFWGLMHRGKVLLREEEFKEAIRVLEKASKTRPDKQDKVRPILNEAQMALKRRKTKDYYKVLGVSRDADERQIKSAYRKASKLYHPDKAAQQGVSKQDAEKKMASVNEAYEVLSNPELRARFDNGDDPNSQEKANPFQGSPFGPGSPFYMFQQHGGGGQQPNFKFHFGGF